MEELVDAQSPSERKGSILSTVEWESDDEERDVVDEGGTSRAGESAFFYICFRRLGALLIVRPTTDLACASLTEIATRIPGNTMRARNKSAVSSGCAAPEPASSAVVGANMRILHTSFLPART